MKKTKDNIRSNWTFNEVLEIYNKSFNELLYEAQTIHRNNFNNSKVQMSTLLSVKTGSCPEDCAYCPQSAHHNTNLEKEKLIIVNRSTDKITKIAEELLDRNLSDVIIIFNSERLEKKSKLRSLFEKENDLEQQFEK